MVYFTQSGEEVKIGYSNDPYRRAMELQSSNGRELTVLLVITGGRIKEKELHIKFRDKHIRGEWFKYKGDIESYIEKNMYRDRKYEFGICYYDFDGNEQMIRIRKKMSLTTTDIANKLQISQQAVSRFENAEKDGSVTLKKMQRFADILGYKFEYRFVKNNVV